MCWVHCLARPSEGSCTFVSAYSPGGLEGALTLLCSPGRREDAVVGGAWESVRELKKVQAALGPITPHHVKG